jgi:gliding motility-associated lipoprotein GldH
MKIANFFPIVLLLFFLSACSHNELFFEFHSIEKADWQRENPATFSVDVKDSLAVYEIWVEVRNNDDYPYRNIWLFIDYQTPEGRLRSDTISADLADVYGKWYGKGLSLHTLSIPYEESLRFSSCGVHNWTIRQGMRENPLKGISDIGLKVLRK